MPNVPTYSVRRAGDRGAEVLLPEHGARGAIERVNRFVKGAHDQAVAIDKRRSPNRVLRALKDPFDSAVTRVDCVDVIVGHAKVSHAVGQGDTAHHAVIHRRQEEAKHKGRGIRRLLADGQVGRGLVVEDHAPLLRAVG
ncbi:MAG TPA: hypothetical protein PK954_00510, partial [Anaerolineales bacterium]|nr:hypothetical protein [Anaerolineales bacterium]